MKKTIAVIVLAALTVFSGATFAETGADMYADIFTDRDFEVGYDHDECVEIQLTGDSAVCASEGVEIDGGLIRITAEGEYILSGELYDSSVMVDADKQDKVRLILSDAKITSASSAAIYVKQADKLFITLAPDTDNSLANGGSFTAVDENDIDAVIFSKDDLTINGAGRLTIVSPAGHGIVSKDDLRVTSGEYNINCASHGMTGNDNVSVANAKITVVSGKDGIHAENSDDASLGCVNIVSGSFSITSEGDGISASGRLDIVSGDFSIVSGGGSAESTKTAADSRGGFFGGRGGSRQTDTSVAESEGDSSKGIKATGNLTISGGAFKIDSSDDSVHSNTSITVNGGDFTLSSGDDAFHADESLAINGGDIDITACYEGFEALNVLVAGGDVSLIASDDGINAAGGTDMSGFGGFRGNDRFGRSSGSSSGGSIIISGGNAFIQSSGDGIDANGTFEMTGGYLVVSGPTQGDTATLDYDVSGTISGGTFIGTGASNMAQTFSGGSQGVIAVSVGSQAQGTLITLKNASGETLISHSPDLPFAVVILSSPDVVANETYSLSIGNMTESLLAR